MVNRKCFPLVFTLQFLLLMPDNDVMKQKSCLRRESILTLKNRLMKKLCRKSGIKPVRSVSSPEAGLPPKQNGQKITPIRYGSALRPMYSRTLVTATFQIWIRVICLFLLKKQKRSAILKLPCGSSNTSLPSCVTPSSKNLCAIILLTIWKVLCRNQRLSTVPHWSWKRSPCYLNVLMPTKAVDLPHWRLNSIC